MSVKPWLQRYSTGIRDIDDHHHELLERMDTLYTALINQYDAKTVDGLIANVIDVTIDHFAAEEKDMNRIGYGQAVEHAVSHQEFRTRLLALRADNRRGRQVGTEALDLLNLYLGNHIKGFDLPLATVLREA
jgi:hemerythrin